MCSFVAFVIGMVLASSGAPSLSQARAFQDFQKHSRSGARVPISNDASGTMSWQQARAGSNKTGHSSFGGPAHPQVRWSHLPAASKGSTAPPMNGFHFAVAAGDAVFVAGNTDTNGAWAEAARYSSNNGNVVWSRVLDEGQAADGITAPTLALGAAATSVYVSAAANGIVSKLNADTGDVVWEWGPAKASEASSSQPIDLFEHQNRTLLGVWAAHDDHAFHMLEDLGSSTSELWSWKSTAPCGSTCGEGSNGVSFAIEPNSKRPIVLLATHMTSLTLDEEIVAHDVMNGSRLWSVQLGFGYNSEGAPLIDEHSHTAFVGLTYGYGPGSRIGPLPYARLLGIDLSTGAVVANISTPQSVANTILAMPSSGGHLFVAGIASTDETSSAVNATVTAFRVSEAGNPAQLWILPVADASVYAVWPTLDGSGKLFVLLNSGPATCRLQSYQLDLPAFPTRLFDVSLDSKFKPTGSGGYGVVEEAAITSDGGIWVPCGNAHGVIGSA